MAGSDLNQLKIPLRLNKTIAQMISKQQLEDSRHPKRKSKRLSVAPGKRILMEFERADGKVIADAIIRDVSDDGAGLWIGCFIHPNTKCWLTLPSSHGAEFIIEGNVRWCKHFTHSVHEIGIQLRADDAKILVEALSDHIESPAGRIIDVQSEIRQIVQDLKKSTETGLTAEATQQLSDRLATLILTK